MRQKCSRISYVPVLVGTVMLVSPPNPKVIAAVNSVITSAFGGMLFDFFYRNRSSNCLIIPYRSTIVDMLIG
jgi:hypothetical protein